MSQDYRLKLSRTYALSIQHQMIKQRTEARNPNAITYEINMQDHTVGDLIRSYLLKSKDVKFSGYRVPHPLDNVLQIKVETNTSDTNRIVKETLKSLQKEIFEMEIELEKKSLDALRDKF